MASDRSRSASSRVRVASTAVPFPQQKKLPRERSNWRRFSAPKDGSDHPLTHPYPFAPTEATHLKINSTYQRPVKQV